MALLTTFSVICSAAVLFLLRFLFALESETRSAQVRKFEMIRVPAYRSRAVGETVGSAPALTLVHSDASVSRRGATLRPVFMSGSVSRESNSQYKGA